MLKYIIIARHGLCNTSVTDRELSKNGVIQMENLAVALNPFLGESAALRIYTSRALWTAQSAEILSAPHNIRPIEFSALFMANPGIDLTNIMELISNLANANVRELLLVTHKHGIGRIASRCAETFLNKILSFPELWEGEAYILDLCQRKSLKAWYPAGKDFLEITDVPI